MIRRLSKMPLPFSPSLLQVSLRRLHTHHRSNFNRIIPALSGFISKSQPLWSNQYSSLATAGSAVEWPSWSSSSASSPLLVLPPETIDDDGKKQGVRNYRFFSLLDNKEVVMPKTISKEVADAYCVGSSHNWLAYVSRSTLGFHLVNLFCPSNSPEIITLPPIEKLLNLVNKTKINFADFEDDYFAKFAKSMALSYIHKFAMSSSPLAGNITGDNNCLAAVSHGYGYKLAFCRLGNASWTHVPSELGGFREILLSSTNQILYGYTFRGDMERWDLTDPSSPKRMGINIEYNDPVFSEGEEDLRDLCSKRHYLVESSEGTILHIVMYYGFFEPDGDGSIVNTWEHPEYQKLSYKTMRFDVYKLDFEKGTGEYVKSLGDNRVVFLGFNHSFSASACEFPELKPNSIYFTDDNFELIHTDAHCVGGGHNMGVYNLEDDTITPLYTTELKKIFPPPIWVCPTPTPSP